MFSKKESRRACAVIALVAALGLGFTPARAHAGAEDAAGATEVLSILAGTALLAAIIIIVAGAAPDEDPPAEGSAPAGSGKLEFRF